MKQSVMIFLMCSFATAQSKSDVSLSFLHTSHQNILNESGDTVYLKGVGLGNWLLPEGYMWKFGPRGDRPRKIEKVIVDLIGEKKAEAFWRTYRRDYITEADIRRIAELGFNSVRPALNSRVFLTEEENPVFKEEGFYLIDSLITWCKKYNVYVILDLHGAPGGQTGANIDDSPNDIPELFVEQKYQDQLVQLWKKIAERYKDEPVVAAYDLLNEPLPINTGAAEKYKHLLVPLYERIIAAIRVIDQKHMITLEGFNWSNDWSLFSMPLDKNVFYQFHYYCWARPDNVNSISEFIKKRNELDTPIWVGETGEKGNTIYWATSQYFAANNIGFSFWPWKKMDTQNTPYSIKMPDHWDLIAQYTHDGPKPDSVIAEKILTEFLRNIPLSHCIEFDDVCNAILNRIPAKIEAENYGFDGIHRSYFVKDSLTFSKYYRTNEPVKVVLDSKDEEQFWSEQSVVLQRSEWTAYTFNCNAEKKYRLSIRASAVLGPSSVVVLLNDRKFPVLIKNNELSEVHIGDILLSKGEQTIKITAASNALKLDWIQLK